jgi:asparagine synthase (glutamine-hydrolysing)
VTLGHRRLAILDLTEAGRQPMVSRSGRFVLDFNGECYNHMELRQELERRAAGPVAFRSGSDTETLVEGWEAWGEGVLDRLVGQFAFAVYDRDERTLTLVRDRFGEKPLFYHFDGRALTFASSLGGLLAARHVPRELDAASLHEYVTLRYVMAPRTILKDVVKLPPGHLLRLAPDGKRELRRWYDPHYTAPDGPLDRQQQGRLVEEFDALFRQATQRCLVSDVPVGLLLSDGIDSNAIRTVLDQDKSDVPSFTFRAGGTVDGAVKARANAGLDGLDTTRLTFSADDRVAAMREAFATLTEPIGDGAALSIWLLLRAARARAKVFLCGHGADELIGGYHLSQDRLRLRVLRRLAFLPESVVGPAVERFVYGAAPTSERLRAFRTAGLSDLPERALYIIHQPLPLDDLSLLSGAPASSDYLASIRRVYAACDPRALDVDRMQKVMIHSFLSENILSFGDSVAMDSSVELRMPFLDRDLSAFVLRLPVAARIGRWPGATSTKRVLRWWSEAKMRQDLANRAKRSFDFGSLRPLLASHGPTLRGYALDVPALRRIFPGLEAWLGQPPETFRGCRQGTLWALLALGVWSEAHQVGA